MILLKQLSLEIVFPFEKDQNVFSLAGSLKTSSSIQTCMTPHTLYLPLVSFTQTQTADSSDSVFPQQLPVNVTPRMWEEYTQTPSPN